MCFIGFRGEYFNRSELWKRKSGKNYHLRITFGYFRINTDNFREVSRVNNICKRISR